MICYCEVALEVCFLSGGKMEKEERLMDRVRNED